MGFLSSAEACVIVVLDERELGLRQQSLARLCDCPTSTMQRALGRLSRQGVILAVVPRGQRVYRLAQDMPRTAIVEIAQWVLGGDTARSVRQRALAAEGVGLDAAAARAAAKRIVADLPATDDARRWIPSAVEAIVNLVHPARIVLFGSQASGGASGDSDADLLVVMDSDPPADRFAVRHAIGGALSGLPIAKDIVVTTTDDIASGRIDATIVAVALQEGVNVYVRGD